MFAGDISIATMTLARDEEEAAVLRRSLAALAALGVQTVITDGGSVPDFVEFLRGFAHFEVIESKSAGVVDQTRVSLRRAAKGSNARFVLYTEPDKTEFFERGARAFADAARTQDGGVLLAARDAESFLTFPESQRYAEGVINKLCAEQLGLDADYCYGPLLIERSLVGELDRLDASIGWGWRFFLFALARKSNLPLAAHVGDFPCPPEQRADSAAERFHRLRQLSQNLQGLLLGLNL